MPHKSIRWSLGKTPLDLKREPWDPDKNHLGRQECSVILTQQKLLVCKPKTGKFFPPTLSSASTNRDSNLSSNATITAVQQTEDKELPYQVVRETSPRKKARDTLNLAKCLLTSSSPDDYKSNFGAIRAAHDYLRQNLKRSD